MNTTQSYYKMQPAAEIRAALEALPVAERRKVWTTTTEAESPEGARETSAYDAIEVNGEVVYMAGSTYRIVQHKAAFSPIVDALVTAGVKDFRFITTSTNRRANLQRAGIA
jgi:hypothetical protein